MSGGVGCSCPREGGEKARRAWWRVVTYHANHSAFNGYRYTPSDYSECYCTRCNARWRTKATYVTTLYQHGGGAA